MLLPVFADHLDRLDRRRPASVIPWAAPVPYFGAALSSVVATVGINPSSLEFTDAMGRELDGQERRLPTLRSLGLQRWADADSRHLRRVVSDCSTYFSGRPYDRWFSVLERVLKRSGFTYYGREPSASHIDLVAFATRQRWSSLPVQERRRLLRSTSAPFALLVRSISARVLVLNGRSVIEAFETSAQTELEPVRMTTWDLPRTGGSVPGFAYVGRINEFAGVPLDRDVTVAGFNHNLQSSFGVTSAVIQEIGVWLASLIRMHQ